MVINQGDVFWVQLRPPRGSEPGYEHPYVVVQSNSFNHTRLNTVVACALTTNLRLAHAVGNVLLDKREANLPKRSIVNITQIMTFDKGDLVKKIGTLSRKRMREILAGIHLLINPVEAE